MSRERLIVDTENVRLDQFLALRRSERTRGFWKNVIGSGAVTVNGAAKSADFKLKGGEIIVIEHRTEEWADPKALDAWVVHEDKDLLVLHKPSGLLMHPLGETWLKRPEAALTEPQPNLAGFLQRGRPALQKLYRCGIVHRLDRQTSGVLLVAKTRKAQESLLDGFKDREISKLYRAIVRGLVGQKEARVDAPIGRKPGHRKIIVTPFGKNAETSFELVKACKGASLVEARPLTGRTHQIRAHLALIGHPVAGDVEFDAAAAEPKAPRLMLHAYSIDLVHPGTGEPVSYRAPVPPDFQAFWSKCR